MAIQVSSNSDSQQTDKFNATEVPEIGVSANDMVKQQSLANPLGVAVGRLNDVSNGNAAGEILDRANSFVKLADGTNPDIEYKKDKASSDYDIPRSEMDIIADDVSTMFGNRNMDAANIARFHPEMISFLAENPYNARLVRDDMIGADALARIGSAISDSSNEVEEDREWDLLGVKAAKQGWNTEDEKRYNELKLLRSNRKQTDDAVYNAVKLIASGTFAMTRDMAEAAIPAAAAGGAAAILGVPAPLAFSGALMHTTNAIQSERSLGRAYLMAGEFVDRDGKQMPHDKRVQVATSIAALDFAIGIIPANMLTESIVQPAINKQLSKAIAEKMLTKEEYKAAVTKAITGWAENVAVAGASSAASQLQADIQIELSKALSDQDFGNELKSWNQMLGTAGEAGIAGAVGALLPVSFLEFAGSVPQLRKMAQIASQQANDQTKFKAIGENSIAAKRPEVAAKLFQGPAQDRKMFIDADGLREVYGDNAATIAKTLGVEQEFISSKAGDGTRLTIDGGTAIKEFGNVIKGKLEKYSTFKADGVTLAQSAASRAVKADLEAQKIEAEKTRERTKQRRMIEQDVKDKMKKAGAAEGRAGMAAKIVGHAFNAIFGNEDPFKAYQGKPLSFKRKMRLFDSKGVEQRGSFEQLQDGSVITFTEASDGTTAMHELGHYLFEVMSTADLSLHPELKNAFDAAKEELGITGDRITTEQLEAFTTRWEKWLAQGMSPKDGLNAVFSVYKNIFARVYGEADVMTSSPITYLFAKILGGEDMIKLAEEEIGLEASSNDKNGEQKSAENVGMNETARQEAEGRIIKRILDGMLKDRKKGLRELEKMAREDAVKEVKDADYSKARKFLETGRLEVVADDGSVISVGKDIGRMSLDIVELRQLVDAKIISQEQFNRLSKLAKSGGDSIQDIAVLFGREKDAIQFLAEIDDARNPDKMIARRSSEIMLEAGLGDYINMDALKDAALNAVLTDKRYSKMASELSYINKLAGRTSGSDIATMRVDAANKALNSVYSLAAPEKLLSKANRLSAKIQKDLANKNWSAAADAKKEYVETLLLRDALRDALKNAQKQERYIKSFREKLPTMFLGNRNLAEAAVALLDTFETKRVSIADVQGARATFDKWVEIASQTSAIIPKEVIDANTKLYIREAKISTINAVHDALESMYGLAKFELELKKSGVEAKRANDIATAISRLQKTFADKFAKAEIGETAISEFVSDIDDVVKRNSLIGDVRMVEFICRNLDGGDINGWFTQNIFRPMAMAEDRVVNRIATANEKVGKALKKLPVDNLLQKVMVPELGKRITREELICIALNYGSESNRERLFATNKFGNKLNEDNVIKILGLLTKDEVALVNTIFEVMNADTKEVVEFGLKLDGVDRTDDMVAATPYKVANGQIIGGYYKLAYETVGNLDEAFLPKEVMQADANIPSMVLHTTKKGMLEARTTAPKDSTLRLDLGVFQAALSERYMALEMTDAARSVGSLLSNKAMLNAIDIAQGKGTGDVMRRWHERITGNNKYQHNLGWKNLRTNSIIAALGGRISTVLANVSGIVPAFAELGFADGIKSLGSVLLTPIRFKKMQSDIASKSIFMKNRLDNFTREAADIVKEARRSPRKARLAKLAMSPLAHLDAAISMSIWDVAYNKYIKELGLSKESEAIALADAAVRTSQSSALKYAMSEFVAGRGDIERTFSTMAGYGTTILNRMGSAASNLKRAGIYGIPAFTGAVLANIMIPSIMDAYARGNGWNPDGEETLIQWFAKTLGGQIAMMIPLLGMFTGRGALPLSNLEKIGSNIEKLSTMATEGEIDAVEAVKASNTIAGPVIGWPSGALAPIIDAVERQMDGEEIEGWDYIRIKRN